MNQSLVDVCHQLLLIQHFRQVLDLDVANAVHNDGLSKTVFATTAMLVHFLDVFYTLSGESMLCGKVHTWN